MKRMWSKNELKQIANQQVQEQVSSGNLTDVKVFEEIVDKDGHKRFIEGNIEIKEIEGVTKQYGKWSLSGSHLLIVVSYIANSGATLGGNTTLAYVDIPSWILDKIAILFGTNIVLPLNIDYRKTDDWTNTTQTASVRKSENSLFLRTEISKEFTYNANTRIAIDILIDNE